MLSETQVATIANEVLGAELGAAGFERANVESGYDHDGDPSFYIYVHFKPRSGIAPGDVSGRALLALRQRLLGLGEERFPYLRYRYPDDEVLIGDDGSGPH
jgi:hypothetical protein